MAKRCASSRTRCIRNSPCDRRGINTGLSRPGTKISSRCLARPTTGANPLIALLLAIGGLTLIIEAQALTYAFVDDYSAAKPMLILLLIIGLTAAGIGTGLAAGRARPQFAGDGPVTASMLALAVGAVSVAYGVLRFLTALGQ